MEDARELLTVTYARFNARDLEGVLKTLDADVDWPNGMEGGRVRGHDEVREYWTRQWGMMDPHVEPVGFRAEPDGRVAVTVKQRVCDLVDQTIEHVYRIEDGLIQSMEIREVGSE